MQTHLAHCAATFWPTAKCTCGAGSTRTEAQARAGRIEQRLGELLAAIDDAELAIEAIDPADLAACCKAITLGMANIVLAKRAYDAERLKQTMTSMLGTVQ